MHPIPENLCRNTKQLQENCFKFCHIRSLSEFLFLTKLEVVHSITLV